jgi:c-di-GMP-related signal transduction protein
VRSGLELVPVATREVVVGRQPIVDTSGALVGYELLYRAAGVGHTAVTGEQMTAEVLFGTLTIGVDQLVGDRLAFCNADRGVLLGETPVTLPPDRTVVEVLETVVIDADVVRGCQELVQRGFQIALDDFVWTDGVEQLLELASIVKIDVLAMSREEVVELVDRCRAYDVLLLAEKVETAEQLAWATEIGFHLFQGYVIERPAQVRGHALPAAAAAHVQLAVHVLADELDFREIEEILRREPGLVVQLLQMAGRGGNQGLRREVRTIRDALVLLGTARVRQWIGLTLLQGQRSSNPDAVITALARARACELLARQVTGASAEAAFTAGLVSALDVLLGVDAHELIAALDLDPDLKRVAFERVGEAGALVARVANFQEDVARGRSEPHGAATDPVLAEAVAAAFVWAAPQANALDAA